MTARRRYMAFTFFMITALCGTMGFCVDSTPPTVLTHHHSGYHGEVIVAPILIENASSILTATLNLSFNPLVLQIVSVNDSAFDHIIPIVNNVGGWVRIGAYQLLGPPLLNRVVVANLTLDLIGDPRDTSPMTFSYVFLENETGKEVTYFVKNGSCTILEDVCHCKKGDCDQDCDIDIFDFDIFGQAWGVSIGDSQFVECHDFNDDQTINVFDLDGFAQVWGDIYCDCVPCSAPPWEPW